MFVKCNAKYEIVLQFANYFPLFIHIFKSFIQVRKGIVQTEATKKFIEIAKDLVKTGAVKNFKALGEEIGVNQSSMSSIMNGRINIPYDIAKTFEKKYKTILVSVTQDSLNSELWERQIRTEAHLEVYESALAGLLSKTELDFMEKVALLRSKVQEAEKRRLDELRKRS